MQAPDRTAGAVSRKPASVSAPPYTHSHARRGRRWRARPTCLGAGLPGVLRPHGSGDGRRAALEASPRGSPVRCTGASVGRNSDRGAPTTSPSPSSVHRDGRRFTVRRELRDATSGPSYRGPRGHLLMCETPLAHSRWERHGVDIAEEGSLPPIGAAPFITGDATFDRRFTAWQDGEPVREGWLDATVRSAVTAFFDAAPLSGSLWVRAGRAAVRRRRTERRGRGGPGRCAAGAIRGGIGVRANRHVGAALAPWRGGPGPLQRLGGMR